MSKGAKKWLIAAASLVVIGGIIFTAVMTVLGWDFKKLSTVKYQTNTYSVSQKFRNITIDTDTADITFLPSADGECKVICFEETKVKHSVEADGTTLTVKAFDQRKWYDYIGIYLDSPKITVYLPKTQYGALFVKESTGDVTVPENFSFDNIKMVLDTGNVNCSASIRGAVNIKTDTGNVKLNGCDSDKIYIETNTGDVKLKGCDADEIYIETDTGNVTGSLLSEKVFITETDTGKINVPKTVNGGKCEIKTDTGDINIKLRQK